MTNDSGLFRTLPELEEREGAYPVGGDRYGSASGQWLPLYVGRMIHQFDHRAASVEVNAENLHNAALSGDITPDQKADPDFLPVPQYWVPTSEVVFPVPLCGLGNTAPIVRRQGFWDSERHHLREALARLVGDVKRLADGAASVGFGWSVV